MKNDRRFSAWWNYQVCKFNTAMMAVLGRQKQLSKILRGEKKPKACSPLDGDRVLTDTAGAGIMFALKTSPGSLVTLLPLAFYSEAG